MGKNPRLRKEWQRRFRHRNKCSPSDDLSWRGEKRLDFGADAVSLCLILSVGTAEPVLNHRMVQLRAFTPGYERLIVHCHGRSGVPWSSVIHLAWILRAA
jgi:hypothetical protein